MKTVWMLISTLAVANFLAAGGLVAWLVATDRLDVERLQRIRAVISPTRAAEKQEADAAAARNVALAAEDAARARLAAPPDAASSRLARLDEAEQVRLQHILRQQREVDDLKRTLDRERARLVAEQDELARERSEFEAYRARLARTEGAEQFQKALATLQGQRPKDAKEVLQSLIRIGQTDQVVSYLTSMEERVRTKVIAEFVKEDEAVAADLLERLRTRGTITPSSARAPMSASTEKGLDGQAGAEVPFDDSARR